MNSLKAVSPRGVIIAVFAIKTLQGLVLLSGIDVVGVPETDSAVALQSVAVAASCTMLAILWPSLFAWLSCAAIAILSLVSFGSNPIWSWFGALSVFGSILVLLAICHPDIRSSARFLRQKTIATSPEQGDSHGDKQ